MMYDAIANLSFMYDAMFWIKNMKSLVPSMSILTSSKLLMQLDQLFLQMAFKKPDILSMSLAGTKLVPSK